MSILSLTSEPKRASRIATQLVDLIDLQKLAPGDKLPPERQLAELLEVSRPSLREALHILQAQGLVQIRHGQGTFVQEPVVAQELRASVMTKTHGLNELFDAREVLEVPASKWAAEKATKEDIRLLRATLNQIDTVTSIEPIDFDQLQSLDAKFHLTIVGIAGNPFINQTLNVLQDVMKMSMETTLRLPGRSDISRSEHNQILAAIETGNGELASKLTFQHITGARATALADAKKKEKENQLKSKGEEGQVKQREMMAFGQTASKILEDKRQRLTTELTEEVNKALSQIAKNKYSMVFVKPQVPSPGALIFSEGMDDITSQILGILNKDAPAGKKDDKKEDKK